MAEFFAKSCLHSLPIATTFRGTTDTQQNFFEQIQLTTTTITPAAAKTALFTNSIITATPPLSGATATAIALSSNANSTAAGAAATTTAVTDAATTAAPEKEEDQEHDEMSEPTLRELRDSTKLSVKLRGRCLKGVLCNVSGVLGDRVSNLSVLASATTTPVTATTQLLPSNPRSSDLSLAPAPPMAFEAVTMRFPATPTTTSQLLLAKATTQQQTQQHQTQNTSSRTSDSRNSGNAMTSFGGGGGDDADDPFAALLLQEEAKMKQQKQEQQQSNASGSGGNGASSSSSGSTSSVSLPTLSLYGSKRLRDEKEDQEVKETEDVTAKDLQARRRVESEAFAHMPCVPGIEIPYRLRVSEEGNTKREPEVEETVFKPLLNTSTFTEADLRKAALGAIIAAPAMHPLPEYCTDSDHKNTTITSARPEGDARALGVYSHLVMWEHDFLPTFARAGVNVINGGITPSSGSGGSCVGSAYTGKHVGPRMLHPFGPLAWLQLSQEVHCPV